MGPPGLGDKSERKKVRVHGEKLNMAVFLHSSFSFSDIRAHQESDLPDLFMPQLLIKELTSPPEKVPNEKAGS